MEVDAQRLYLLLMCSKELMGHPNHKRLKDIVDKEIVDMEADILGTQIPARLPAADDTKEDPPKKADRRA